MLNVDLEENTEKTKTQVWQELPLSRHLKTLTQAQLLLGLPHTQRNLSFWCDVALIYRQQVVEKMTENCTLGMPISWETKRGLLMHSPFNDASLFLTGNVFFCNWHDRKQDCSCLERKAPRTKRKTTLRSSWRQFQRKQRHLGQEDSFWWFSQRFEWTCSKDQIHVLSSGRVTELTKNSRIIPWFFQGTGAKIQGYFFMTSNNIFEARDLHSQPQRKNIPLQQMKKERTVFFLCDKRKKKSLQGKNFKAVQKISGLRMVFFSNFQGESQWLPGQNDFVVSLRTKQPQTPQEVEKAFSEESWTVVLEQHCWLVMLQREVAPEKTKNVSAKKVPITEGTTGVQGVPVNQNLFDPNSCLIQKNDKWKNILHLKVDILVEFSDCMSSGETSQAGTGQLSCTQPSRFIDPHTPLRQPSCMCSLNTSDPPPWTNWHVWPKQTVGMTGTVNRAGRV